MLLPHARLARGLHGRRHYGCLVTDEGSVKVQHYVEKPSTFVSTDINAGVYLCTPSVFDDMKKVFLNNCDANIAERDMISFEKDALTQMAGADGPARLFLFRTNNFWSQVKTAGSAIYANRHYLAGTRRARRARRAAPQQSPCPSTHMRAACPPPVPAGWPRVGCGRVCSPPVAPGVALETAKPPALCATAGFKEDCPELLATATGGGISAPTIIGYAHPTIATPYVCVLAVRGAWAERLPHNPSAATSRR